METDNEHDRDELHANMVQVREWWREEDGSDARMGLRVKLRLWLQRSREATADERAEVEQARNDE